MFANSITSSSATSLYVVRPFCSTFSHTFIEKWRRPLSPCLPPCARCTRFFLEAESVRVTCSISGTDRSRIPPIPIPTLSDQIACAHGTAARRATRPSVCRAAHLQQRVSRRVPRGWTVHSTSNAACARGSATLPRHNSLDHQIPTGNTTRVGAMGKPLNVAPQGNAPANSDRSAEVGVRNQPRVGSATRTAIVDWPPCPTSTPSSMPTSLARSPRPKPSAMEANSSKSCTDVMPAPGINFCLPPLGSRGRSEG